MTHLKQSVSLCALAMGLSVVATPVSAQQTSASPDQAAALDVSQAKIAAANKDAAAAGDADKTGGADIVVTGTHIGRPNIGSPSPIVSITSEEIKQQGAVSAYDILERLPQIAPDNQAVYQDGTGQQQVQLRGLGPNRTLSLIDGQRIATSEGININAIPIALIDRVDVLTGGGASIYGADAVAGVVNFVIKKDFKGLQLNVTEGGFLHDNSNNNLGADIAKASGANVPRGTRFDGGKLDVSVAAGHSFFDDRLSVEAYGEYVKTNPVLTDNRDFSSCYLTQTGGVNTLPTCSVDALTQPYGSFSPQSALAGANQGKTFSDAKNGTNTFVANDASFNYLNFSGNYLQQPSKRYNAGIFLNLDLGSHLSVYGNYNMNYQTSLVQHGPYYGFRIFDPSDYNSSFANYNVNCNNPFLSAQQAGILCGTAAGTAQQVPVKLRYLLNTNFHDEYINFDQRVSAGLRGKFLNDALKFDVNFVFSRFDNEQNSAPNNAQPNRANIQQSLLVGGTASSPTCLSGAAGCVPFNVFTANTVNQALIDWFYGTARGHGSNDGYLYDYTGNVSLDLGKFGIASPLAHDGVVIAGGLEYRIDREINTADAAFTQQKGGTDLLRSQNVKEAYLETSLPLMQDSSYGRLLSLTGSYRWSKYDTHTQDFHTWQIGALYSPVSDVTFRVSYNKASREPTVYEQDQNTYSFVGGAGDPCATTPAVIQNGVVTTPAKGPTASAAKCANTGVTAAEYGNIPQCQNNSCLARSGGGQIEPETAHTLTYGAIVKPRFIPNLTLSIDHFNIRVDDAIGYSYDSDFMNGCLDFGIPFYCSHIVRNANGTLTSAATFQQGTIPTTGFTIYGSFNAYRDTTAGWDFQAEYSVPVEPLRGRIDFNLNGALTTLRGGQDSPAVAPHNVAGYFGPYAGNPQPSWKHNLRATYKNDRDDFSLSANWRYISPLELSTDSGDPAINGTPGQYPVTLFDKIPAYSYFDLSATYTIAKRYSLSLVANNIFDKLPPILTDSYCGSYGCYLSRANTIVRTYDPLGRFLQVRLTANF